MKNIAVRVSIFVLIAPALFAATVSADEPVAGGDSMAPAKELAAGAEGVSELSMEQIAARLTDSMQRIQSYEATYELKAWHTQEDKPYLHRVIVSAMERVPDNTFPFLDKRCERAVFLEPDALGRAIQTEGRALGFDGSNTYVVDREQLRYVHLFLSQAKRDRWQALPGMNSRYFARGLTLECVATHFLDVTPIERVVSNGTFRVVDVTDEAGYRCVVVRGKLALPEDPESFELGGYCTLYLAMDCGFMPVRQEWPIKNADGSGAGNDVYTSELNEVAPGVWFPVAAEFHRPYLGHPSFTVRAELVVEDLVVNADVPEDRFNLKSLPDIPAPASSKISHLVLPALVLVAVLLILLRLALRQRARS